MRSLFCITFLLFVNVLYCATPITGTLEVLQNDISNSPESISLSISSGSSSGLIIDYQSSNRGDYFVSIPVDDPVANGVMISSVAQNGRNNSLGGGVDTVSYATSSVDVNNAGVYFISTSEAPSGGELNINVAFGWFPYSDWLGGMTARAENGGPLSIVSIASGVIFDDTSDGGISHVTFPGSAGPNEGILLVCSGQNEDNHTGSYPLGSNSFSILNRDNGSDIGSGIVWEQDPVAFVYLPIADVGSKGLVALGRMKTDGSAILSGGNFSLTPSGIGTWFLTIPGHSADTGTLLISPEMQGGAATDNVLSYEWDSGISKWRIETRDIPSMNLETSGTGQDTVFSFAFIETRDAANTDAKRIYVDQNSTGANNGTSWADAYTELTYALDAARDGDDIWVAQGSYKPQPGFGRSDTFRINNPIRLIGGFEPGMTDPLERNRGVKGDRTILSGEIGDVSNDDNVYHVVTADPGDGGLLIDGFEIRGGNRTVSADLVSLAGPPGGAGLLFPGSAHSAQITNCTFSENRAVGPTGEINFFGEPQDGGSAFGAAIYAGFTAGTLTISECAFYSNKTTGGAGRDSTVQFTSFDSSIRLSGNHAADGADGQGGAVWIPAGSVIGCLFENNQAGGGKGGRGINGRDGDSNVRDGLRGSDGGDGGSALGGAVYIAFTGAIEASTFHANQANAGRGGDGGIGGEGDDGGNGSDGGEDDPGGDGGPGFYGFHGGNGGESGQAYGGGIYFPREFNSSNLLENCVFVGNSVSTSNAGSGGDGGRGGNGGDGGDGDSDPIADGEDGGDGGDSGDGGDGGNGGDVGPAHGGAVYVATAGNNYVIGSHFVMNRVLLDGAVGPAGSRGGHGSTGGVGSGGDGGFGGDGANGSSGDFGDNGTAGSSGQLGPAEGAAMYAASFGSSFTASFNSIYWQNTIEPDVQDHFGGSAPTADRGTNIANDTSAQGLTRFDDVAPGFIRMPDRGAGGWYQTPEDNDYGDLRLRPTSAAYNTGSNTELQGFGDSNTDIVGDGRTLDGIVNIGAYERVYTTYFEAYPSTATSVDSNNDGFSNLENYLLGTDPFGPIDPLLVPTFGPEGNNLVFRYKIRSNDLDPALDTIHYEISYDLVNWREPIHGLDGNLIRSGTTSGFDTFRLSPYDSIERIFMRRVSRPTTNP